MAKKDRYNYSSPAAAGLGLAVTGAVSMIPGATPIAGPLGTMATGLFGGVDLTDEEKNIKKKFDEAINKTWDQINDDYKLTGVCFSKLKQEVIGENTSTDEFVDNFQRKKLKESYALVIQTILEKYRGGLERRSKKTWDDEYIKIASKDIASRLIRALQNVFNEDDLLKILKVIADRSNDIRGDISKSREANRLEHEQLMQALSEISKSINSKRIYSDVPLALTTIPAPTEKLIGREKAIEEIQDLLARHKIVFIHAHGGVGKTAVASEIANQIKDEIISGKSPYKHVAWITSTGDLKSDLTGLSIPLVDTMKTQEEKHQIVSSYLQSNPTFLVIDNMDEPPSQEDSNELNTLTGQTKILITSRADIPNADEYLLVDMDHDSALVLFYRHFTRKEFTIEQICDRKDYSYGEKIVETATFNALLTELIGKMAYADHLELGSLWEKLSADVFGVDSKHSIKSIHGEGKLLEHIQKLYKMSGLSERQKEIMSFMALFPAEYSIFFDVFEWAGFEDDEEDNLGELQDRGWIVRDEEGYLVHTMIKGSLKLQRGKCVFDEEQYKNLIVELSDTSQYIPKDMAYTEVRDRIIVPQTICRILAGKASKNVYVATFFNNIAIVYRAQGNYEEALKCFEMARDIYKKTLGEEHRDIVMAYNGIAGIFDDLGNFDESLKHYKKALDICQKVLGKDNLDTALVYNNIAGVYLTIGEYNKALYYYEAAYTIYQKKLEGEHLDVATVYNNMAAVYEAQGKYDDSLKYLKMSQEIYEKVLVKEHPLLGTTFNNIGTVLREQRNYVEALDYLKKGLEIHEKIYGKNHPATAFPYCNIALLFSEVGDYDKALEYYEKALTIRKKALGEDHPDTASSYNSIGVVYNGQKQYDKALGYYKKALTIRENVLGRDHPLTAVIYSNMGAAYRNLGQCDKALKYFDMALAVRKKVLGEYHPNTALTYESIAETYRNQRQYEKSLEYYDKALTFREKVQGGNNQDTALTYESIAKVYSEKGQHDKAVKYFKKALAARASTLGKDHLLTALTYNNIAVEYSDQGQHDKAQQYYEKALEVFDRELGMEHTRSKLTRVELEEAKKAIRM